MIDLRRFGIDVNVNDIDVNDEEHVKDTLSSAFNLVSKTLTELYPDETKDLSILNLRQPHARVHIKNWAKLNDFDLGPLPEHKLHLMANNSFVGIAKKPLIGIHTDLSEPMYLQANFLKQVGTRALHEFAHLSLKVANVSGDLDSLDDYAKHIRAESAADLFSSIHSLRLGWINKRDIVDFSNSRAFNMMLGDIEHADFRAMDWLADQVTAADWKAMSPQQISRFVEIVSKNFMPRQGEIIDASDCFEILRETLGDKTDDYADPKKLRRYIAKNAEKMEKQIDAFYDVMENMHRRAPAQSLAHQATAKILNEVIRGNNRFLPPYPATRDGRKIINEILQRSTEKKSTAFIDNKTVFKP